MAGLRAALNDIVVSLKGNTVSVVLEIEPAAAALAMGGWYVWPLAELFSGNAAPPRKIPGKY